ncbi:MAG: hypothetical protein AAF668_01700 [Pseudomonadota bacterium]
MPTSNPTDKPRRHDDREAIYDLCIVGMGVAGLNALFVAKQYLKEDAKIAVIDRHDGCGGMWNTVYDYVRLHQPYELFTVGNIKWTLKRPPDYLATGKEVLDHFQYCFDRIKSNASIDEYWGTEVTSISEAAADDPEHACLAIRPLSENAQERVLRCRQVIDARALNVPVKQALALSSDAVTSIAPQHFSSKVSASDNRPIYIVGGGKTGMDTAFLAVSQNPNRKVVLVAGRGTAFSNRDIMFPTGMQKYLSLKSNFRATLDVVMRFDGTNAPEVSDYFRQMYAVSPGNKSENFFFGLLSEHENALIRDRVADIIFEYLEDVVDADTGPAIKFRTGELVKIEEGAVVVNCTGYLTRRESPKKAILSGSGRVLSISPRAAFHPLPGISAYFSTHLMFKNLLSDNKFYVVDNEVLSTTADTAVWHMAVLCQILYNMIYALDVLPMKVFQDFGLDFERWQPVHKRLLSFGTLIANKDKYKDHCGKALERVSVAHAVACHPFKHDTP